MKTIDIDRLFTKVAFPSNIASCWIWIAGKDGKGYGSVKIDGIQRIASRVFYKLAYGELPDLPLDHLCRVITCVNPLHLEPVTQRINVLRGNGVAAINAKKTHCKHGHEFSAENTYHGDRNGRNIRECRTCNREKQRRLYRARRM